MTQTSSNSVPAMRILKVATCPTNSGKATLTYHIGCTTINEIYLRVVVNTGGGLFSPEWVSFSAIKPALEQAPIPLTSFPLIKLYQGKSTNTPAFLMAVLKNEGLVRNLEGKVRGYEILDSKAFMDAIHTLIASDVDIKVANISANYKTSVALNKSAATPLLQSAKSIKAKKPSSPNAAPEAPIAA